MILTSTSVPTNGKAVAPRYPTSQQMATAAKLMAILGSAVDNQHQRLDCRS